MSTKTTTKKKQITNHFEVSRDNWSGDVGFGQMLCWLHVRDTKSVRISVSIHLAPPWKWILTLPIELEQPAAAMVGWPVLSTPDTNTIEGWKIMKKWIPKTFATSESLGCFIYLYHSALWRNREIKTGIFFKVHLRCNGCLNPVLNCKLQVLKKNWRTWIPNWLLLTTIRFVYFWGNILPNPLWWIVLSKVA